MVAAPRFFLRFGWVVFATACTTSPPCDTVTLSDATLDTSSGTPVLAWTGAAADITWVDDTTQTLVWEVRCNCEAEDKRPDTNAGCKDTPAEFDYRHCLDTPLTYGELPDDPQIALAEDYDRTKSTPDPLVPGATYRASVTAFCNGGGDGEPNFVEQIVSFVAP